MTGPAAFVQVSLTLFGPVVFQPVIDGAEPGSRLLQERGLLVWLAGGGLLCCGRRLADDIGLLLGGELGAAMGALIGLITGEGSGALMGELIGAVIGGVMGGVTGEASGELIGALSGVETTYAQLLAATQLACEKITADKTAPDKAAVKILCLPALSAVGSQYAR